MRARSIKPGFFQNELLPTIEPLGRLLFIGLWTISDRAGRLEDRPVRIKGQLFPYEDCPVDGYLSQLVQLGFIIRYEIENNKYIQIVNFEKHQHIHVKEAPSTIPAPDKPGACQVQTPDENQPSTPLILNPSTLILNPTELPSNEGSGKNSDEFSPETAPNRCPIQKIVALYHEKLPELPKCRKITTAREAAIRQRWREDIQNLDDWEDYFVFISRSPFLMGKLTPTNGHSKPFIASLDWLVKAENYAKIYEGRYHG